MMGGLSLEGDISGWSAELTSAFARWIKIFKSVRHLLDLNVFYPLPVPQNTTNWDAIQFSSYDSSHVVVFVFPGRESEDKNLILKQLVDNSDYRLVDHSNKESRVISSKVLTNKVAIVTGGSRGIGAGVVDKFAIHGAKIIIADISLDESETFADKLIKKGHDVYAFQTDVTKIDSVESMVSDTIKRFKTIDILVNNAGVWAAPGFVNRTLSEPEDWDITFEVNLKAVATVTNAVVPHMKNNSYGKTELCFKNF